MSTVSNTESADLQSLLRELSQARAALADAEGKLATSEGKLTASKRELATSERELAASERELAASERELATSKHELATSERERLAAESKLASVLEQLRLARHRMYGRSAEDAPGQGLLFNEAETIADPITPSQNNESDTAQTATAPRSRGTRRPLPTDLPRIEIVHALPEAQRICACGDIQQEIGSEVSEQLDIVPMQVRVLRHVRVRYACACGEHAPVCAPMPAQPIPRSIASPATLAMIATLKFVDAVPLYRIEQRVLQRSQVSIPRQTLARWMIQSGTLIQPLLNLLRDHLHDGALIHCDETPVQVLKEPDKPPESTSYMWVQVGGEPERPVILFDYDPSRSGSVPERLLADWKGALMTDGYDGYNAVAASPGVVHLACWAHARRRFIEAQRAQTKGKTGKADVAIGLIGKLYAIERRIAKDEASVRQHAREHDSRPVLAELRSWLDKALPDVPPKSALGSALAYLHKYWSRLARYTDDSRWPIDNNRAENAIRPFVIGRKNWLFSDTPKGAHASAALYSLIETARANGLEPYTYLCRVFTHLPHAQSLADFEALLPWQLSQSDLITPSRN